jgi:hypothetical protein
VLLDDHGRVRSHMTSVVCQIQRFDFDFNLVVTRNLSIRILPPLRFKHLYEFVGSRVCLCLSAPGRHPKNSGLKILEVVSRPEFVRITNPVSDLTGDQ